MSKEFIIIYSFSFERFLVYGINFKFFVNILNFEKYTDLSSRYLNFE